MKKISVLTAIILFFSFAVNAFGQGNTDKCQAETNFTFGVVSLNSTPIMNNPSGVEQTNYNQQYVFAKVMYTPPKYGVSFGLKGFGLFDNNSSGGGGAVSFASKNFRMDLGVLLSIYRKDAPYRDSANSKDVEKAWYASMWAGTGKFEFFSTAFGNTNSIKYCDATALIYPVSFWGIGARLEKNFPRNMNLMAYTEFAIHKVPGLGGLTVTMYAAAGGYGENGKIAVTSSFGFGLSWTGKVIFK